MNISILLAFLASYNETDLFDSVRVDGGLRLQDAHRLCLLGALRHLPHLLSDEVMDTIQCLHSPLDQTHTLCCAYTNTHTDGSVCELKLVASGIVIIISSKDK